MPDTLLGRRQVFEMASANAEAPILLITGVMAAGKSSVAQVLAERLDMSVHLRGDVFRRMVVDGRVEMSARPDAEAMRQLMLRYQAASQTARLYSEAGFNVVYQDIIIGPVLDEVVAMYRGLPLYVVVLCPRTNVIVRRESGRSKSGYGSVTVEQLQKTLEETPRLGLWIDSSDQSAEETADAILADLNRARVASQ